MTMRPAPLPVTPAKAGVSSGQEDAPYQGDPSLRWDDVCGSGTRRRRHIPFAWTIHLAPLRVTPAKAGVSSGRGALRIREIPAFAEMTYATAASGGAGTIPSHDYPPCPSSRHQRRLGSLAARRTLRITEIPAFAGMTYAAAARAGADTFPSPDYPPCRAPRHPSEGWGLLRPGGRSVSERSQPMRRRHAAASAHSLRFASVRHPAKNAIPYSRRLETTATSLPAAQEPNWAETSSPALPAGLQHTGPPAISLRRPRPVPSLNHPHPRTRPDRALAP